MSDHQPYARIEERFAFKLPKEYRALYERGWLTLDRPASAISTTPGDGYLFMHEMEWYRLEEIATFEFPENDRPCLPGLIPFAVNGAGDNWCWQSDKTDEHGTPVLLCDHETGRATIYAPNFQAALFRQALQYAHSLVGSKYVPIAEGHAYLRRWAIDLATIFPPDWCRVLTELSTRAPVAWSARWGSQNTLLTPDDLKHILDRHLQFNQMGSEIQWANISTAARTGG